MEVLAYFKHAMRVNVKLLAEATRRNERNGYTTPPPQHPPSAAERVGDVPAVEPTAAGDGQARAAEVVAEGKKSKSLLSRRVQAKSGAPVGGGAWQPPPGTITL